MKQEENLGWETQTNQQSLDWWWEQHLREYDEKECYKLFTTSMEEPYVLSIHMKKPKQHLSEIALLFTFQHQSIIGQK